ncbi:MAG: hypothetical protein NW204_01710 [Xanthomonadaceae bacterium]|nr:hypothetical protein [Xanthomonadaceae bacterium]
MLDEPEPSTERAIAAIEEYLARHPAAADGEQGVAQWWLPAVGVDVSIEHVRRALKVLCARGRIECTVLPDGGMVYHAPRRTA